MQLGCTHVPLNMTLWADATGVAEDCLVGLGSTRSDMKFVRSDKILADQTDFRRWRSSSRPPCGQMSGTARSGSSGRLAMSHRETSGPATPFSVGRRGGVGPTAPRRRALSVLRATMCVVAVLGIGLTQTTPSTMGVAPVPGICDWFPDWPGCPR